MLVRQRYKQQRHNRKTCSKLTLHIGKLDKIKLFGDLTLEINSLNKLSDEDINDEHLRAKI